MCPACPPLMCNYCGVAELETLLDLGPQPIAHRFLRQASESELLHQLSVVLCARCGTVQLASPLAPEQLVPRFDWITNREPEEHLDALVRQLLELPRMTLDSTIIGITDKDQSTLERLSQLGYGNVRRLDPVDDLDIMVENAGIETIESVLDASVAASIVEHLGRADLIVARHILEHAHHPAEFLDALRILVKPEGYIVIEVPDGSRMFELLDYSAVWEEHLAYFTVHSLRSTLEENGFEIVDIDIYGGGHENLIVAMIRPGLGRVRREQADDEGIERARRFGLALAEESERIRSLLSTHRADTGKVALLGAGHLSASYVNVHGLAGSIEFVVDDDPHKQGLFMPGSRLPIVNSSALTDGSISLCLLGVGPASEASVFSHNREFLDGGGRFASILPASRLAL